MNLVCVAIQALKEVFNQEVNWGGLVPRLLTTCQLPVSSTVLMSHRSSVRVKYDVDVCMFKFALACNFSFDPFP